MVRQVARKTLLALPLLFIAAFFLVPLGLSVAISFWERVGLGVRPAFTLHSYAECRSGVRFAGLERSLFVAAEVTLAGLLIAYPIAYVLAVKASRQATRLVLLLFTIPFLVNYVIRTFSWSYLLSRTGPVNQALIAFGLADRPVDWLLYSDFAVFIVLLISYMPFMVFLLWLALACIAPPLRQSDRLLR